MLFFNSPLKVNTGKSFFFSRAIYFPDIREINEFAKIKRCENGHIDTVYIVLE